MAEQHEVAGGVFSAQIGTGRAGAQLRVQDDGVHAVTSEGQQFQLGWDVCQLRVGGASGRMWFCAHADGSLTFFSEGPQLAAALRGGAPAPIVERVQALEAEARQRARRAGLGWLLLLGACALVAFAGYLGLGRAANAGVRMLPRSLDEKLGELALENMDLEGKRLSDPLLQDGVRAITDRLQRAGAAGGFTLKVHVVDADIVNAFALPGGEVVVYTGLIRAAERPEQLAAVLAHELSHVARRHGMHRIARSVGVVGMVQLLFGDVSGLSAAVLALLREGTINAYSRDQEREADADAVVSLSRAKLDPGALAEFFALLARRDKGLPGALRWLGTHPELDERIAAVRSASKDRPAAAFEPLQLDWPALQARAGGRTGS